MNERDRDVLVKYLSIASMILHMYIYGGLSLIRSSDKIDKMKKKKKTIEWNGNHTRTQFKAIEHIIIMMRGISSNGK